MSAKKVILAVDCDNVKYAVDMINKLGDYIDYVKLGLEFFVACGPSGVSEVKNATGKSIFLDLKLHDIPNTVRQAVYAVCKHDVAMLTLHAAGGELMLRTAVEAVAGSNVLLLGVTVLTCVAGNMTEIVRERALLSYRSGLGGIVCSAREVKAVRSVLPDNFRIVVPGIRMIGDNVNDQSRTGTPYDVCAAGADFIVVGRSVTDSDDPILKMQLIVADVMKAV